MKRALPFHSPNVWPPAPLVTLFFIIYAMVVGGLGLMELRMGIASEVLSDSQEFKKIHQVILGAAAVVYALYRLVRFHPACNRPYAAWLMLSPWTSARPLPLGPVHPVWQDAVVIGLLTAMAQWLAHVDPTLPVVAFGLTWLVGMTIIMAITRTWPAFLALGFLWPALILPGVTGWPGMMIIVGLILIILLGHRRSLQSFPWPFLSNANPLAAVASGRSGQNVEIRIEGVEVAPSYLGWPNLVLSPKIRDRSIADSTSFCLSALAGWWLYCVIECSEMDSSTGPGLVFVFAFVAALLRLALYCSNVGPPFSVLGRLASGQLIQPGFDQVFLTPLAVILTGIAGGMVVKHSGSWYASATSCVFASLWLLLFIGGPTRQSWILTGRLRFRTPANQANSQRLRRI